MNHSYDYIIVGSGLYGATFAQIAKSKGKRVLILEKRQVIGGNCATELQHGIQVHLHGPHIFHTSHHDVWQYVRRFAEFNHFVHSPIAISGGKMYNLPFNMNTFYQLWGTQTPEDAIRVINQQRKVGLCSASPHNLEEQALQMVGRDIYERLIKVYSEKQWGKKCTELPAFIIKRLPLRFTYDNRYFDDCYQGIPKGGYTQMIQKMVQDIEIRYNVDYLQSKEEYRHMANKVIFTGPIDRYFNYCYGALEYRSLRFEHEWMPETDNLQGNAVVNFADSSVPYTRRIEHKHFEFGKQQGTMITKEYSDNWIQSKEAYYPINDTKNQTLYQRYYALSQDYMDVSFGGRLGEYKYYDMDQVVKQILNRVEEI